jgi:hypothetical protein
LAKARRWQKDSSLAVEIETIQDGGGDRFLVRNAGRAAFAESFGVPGESVALSLSDYATQSGWSVSFSCFQI